jgi:hypothetical protein
MRGISLILALTGTLVTSKTTGWFECGIKDMDGSGDLGSGAGSGDYDLSVEFNATERAGNVRVNGQNYDSCFVEVKTTCKMTVFRFEEFEIDSDQSQYSKCTNDSEYILVHSSAFSTEEICVDSHTFYDWTELQSGTFKIGNYFSIKDLNFSILLRSVSLTLQSGRHKGVVYSVKS